MSRFILLMLSCRWHEGVFSGCLLIKWNKTNLQCLKSGWTKTSCAIQLWSIVARFRNFANDRVVHGSFLNPLIWTSDLKRCSNFLTVGGQVFLHSDALKHLSLWDIALHLRAFTTHPHLLHFSKVKMHEMLTSRLLFPSVMSESGRCDGLLIREGRKNSHLSVINKGLMKVVYQMKTAERLRDKSWGNFPSFRRRLASRQLPRRRSSAQVYSVRVRQWSCVTRPRVGRDPTCRVSLRFYGCLTQTRWHGNCSRRIIFTHRDTLCHVLSVILSASQPSLSVT